MENTETKPSILKFVLKEGGLRGIWRGFLLSEIYAFLYTILIVALISIEGGASYEPFGFALFALFTGQMFGVLPSVVIGLVTGTAIARSTIALRDRDAATASSLAAAVALIITLLIDFYLFFATGKQIVFIYAIYFGVPSLILIFEAMRSTRKQLPKVVETFPPGNLQPRVVKSLFWLAVVVKLFVLAFFFVP